jgi:hypothetical protein
MTTTTKKKIQSPKLKGTKNPEATSASLIIDAHYAKLGLRKLWDAQRVNRLCSFLRMTHEELASLLHLKGSLFRMQCQSMKPLSGPVCLLLTILEHRYMSEYAPDTIPNIFKFTDND